MRHVRGWRGARSGLVRGSTLGKRSGEGEGGWEGDLPALEQGRQVKLSGFGNFDLRRKNQRPGRNPKTGEEIPISARTVVTFRTGQKLKERVEAYSGAGHA